MKRIIYLLTALLMASSGYSQTAEEYYNRGNAKYYRQDYSGAIADFNKAVEINPILCEAYHNR